MYLPYANSLVANSWKVPLFIMAARNNPLISWTNCSFDTYNLLHRWFGRIVALEAITHTVAFGVQEGTFSKFTTAISGALYIQFGVLVSARHF